MTAIAPEAVTADWMSTAVFLEGGGLAEQLCRKHPGVLFLIFERGTRPGEYRLTEVPAGR